MVLLIDANSILDVLLNRPEFVKDMKVGSIPIAPSPKPPEFVIQAVSCFITSFLFHTI